MPDKIVLIADNDRDFLNTRAEYLEDEDYRVLKAYSLNEARRLLQNARVHLAILDIRLLDDDDERDTSGLTLAKAPEYSAIPKIVLTGFPTFQAVRAALGPAVDGMPPAVNFLAKKEGAEAMLQAVADAFERHVRLNPNLTIHYGEHISPVHLVNLIEPDLDSARLPERVGILEDLFRRLFANSSELHLNRLLVRREGRVFLSAFAYPEAGAAKQFVVACGQTPLMQQEHSRYRRFVAAMPGREVTIQDKTAETVPYTAAAYLIIGGDLEDIATFSEFYRYRPADAVLPVLDRLFNHTLAPWHRRERYETTNDTLNDLCREWLAHTTPAPTSQALGNRLQALCRAALGSGLPGIDYSPTRLTFMWENQPLPNPLPHLFERQVDFTGPVLCGLTHGQLNGHSILVDNRGRTWLIDFSRAGQAPLLCDFVLLEVAIKYDLLTAAGLEERLALEQRLLSLPGLLAEADPRDLNPDLQKALAAVCAIRRLAGRVAGADESACRTYQIGLLHATVAHLAKFNPAMRYTRRQLAAYLHGLLAAAMLCRRLAPPPRQNLPPDARQSLWIDEANRQVWVEGRQATLTPHQFKLLLYLHQNRNRLCDYGMIAEHVFGVTFEPGLSDDEKRRMEESRINSTVSRLRKRLEPDPANPKYIITVRGEGYRLNLEQELS